MRRYVSFYMRERIGNGPVSYQISRLSNSPMLLEELRRAQRTVAEDHGQFFHLLCLPDSAEDRRSLSEIQGPGAVKVQKSKYGNTVYLALSPLDDEEDGVYYISAAAPLVAELSAKMIGLPYGTIGVVVYYQGTRFSLSGERPSLPTKDLWRTGERN